MANIKANGVLIKQLRQEMRISGKSVSQMALANLSSDRRALSALKGEEPPRWINEFGDRWLSAVETRLEDHFDEALLKSLAYILGTSFESITFTLYANPYKGLKAFRVEDAEFFGGREHEAREVFERLSAHRLVGIIGASGSGKSSLAFAGVNPLIRKGRPTWEVLSLRIGAKPIESLFYALDHWLFPNADQKIDRPTRIRKFQENIRLGNDALYHYLKGFQGDTDKVPVLIIDQWEELYTLCKEEEDRETFLQNLIEAVRGNVVRILLTVRADFYDRLLCSPSPFFDMLRPNLIDLQPMTPSQLRKAIEQPQERTGLQFADGLIDQLLEDVGVDQSQLPILQFSLFELWANRDVDRNLVNFEAYRNLGGIKKIIERHANKVIATELDATELALTQLTLPTLVNMGEQGNDVKLRLPLSHFGTEQKVILQKLSGENCRLLSIFPVPDANDPTQEVQYVELAHEELIRSWPALRKWLERDSEFHLSLSRLRVSYQKYVKERGHTDYLIPEGKQLEEAKSLLSDFGPRPLGELRAFIDASVKNAEERTEKERKETLDQLNSQKWMIRFLTGAVSIAAVFAFFVVKASREADVKNGALLVSEAERMSEELRTDAALLVLLQANDLVARSGPVSPESRRVEAAALRVLDRAERERRFEIPGDSKLFEHENALYFVSPTATGLWWIDPDSGPVRIADWPGILIGSAVQHRETDFPVLLALQQDSTVIVFKTDPSTGRRGNELLIDIAAIDPATVHVSLGPDGRGLISGKAVAAGKVTLGEEQIGKSWVFDLVTGHIASVPLDVPEPVILVVDDQGRSLLGQYANWDESSFRDFNFTPTAFAYDINQLPYVDCLRKGGFGDQSTNMAANMASMVSPVIESPEIEWRDDELVLLTGYAGAVCKFSSAHSSFSSDTGTGSTGIHIVTSVWGSDDWLNPSYPLWWTKTYGWQKSPSLFSADPTSTTLAIADTSDVMVLRLAGWAQDYAYDEQRVPFVHNVEHATAVGPNRIVAVEGFFNDLPGPSRRVTVLSLKPPSGDRIGAFEDEQSLEFPSWPDVCLSHRAEDYGVNVGWVARDRIEVSPDRQPDHVVTLPPELADFVHGDRTAEAAGLTPEAQELCIAFTPDGSAFSAETAAGTTVFNTSSGERLAEMPQLNAFAPVALLKSRREALISEDRRTIERLWQNDDGKWQREPVLYTPFAVDDLFLAPSEEALIVIYQRGDGMVEARAISMGDYRELAVLGSNFKTITPQLEEDGSIIFPELALSFTPDSAGQGAQRLEAALSTACKPENRNWQTSPCWPDELKLGTDQLVDEGMP